MKRAFKLGSIFLVVVIIVVFACRILFDRDKEIDSIEALIDQFADIDSEIPGASSISYAYFFAGRDEEFPAAVFGPLLRRPPIMRKMDPRFVEVVRRGVAALPFLLERLRDAQRTRIVIGDNGQIRRMAHRNLHDTKNFMARTPESGLSLDPASIIPSNEYTLCVGDLCYLAIGQIINRPLFVVYYVPSMQVVINSPILDPRIETSLVNEYTGITEKIHKELLTADLGIPTGSGGAIERLCFYYPKLGEERAIELLGRWIYDDYDLELEAFQIRNLDPVSLVERIKTYRDEPRQFRLQALSCSLLEAFHRAQDLEERRQILDVLRKFDPMLEPDAPPFLNAASISNQLSVVSALQHFRSSRVDKIVRELRSEVFLRRNEFKEGRVLNAFLRACDNRRLFEEKKGT